MFRYRESLHDDSKLTAMCFDDGGRRLVTGYHNGTLRMTNFSSGECLTEFIDRRRVDDGQQEVTAVAFVRERKSDSNAQYLVSVGWDRQLTVWPDSGDGGEQSPRRVANDDVEVEKRDSEAESSENDSDVEYFSDSDEPRSSPRLRSLALPVHGKDAPLMSARSSNGAPASSRTAREQVDQRTQRRRQLLSERDAGPQTSRQATRGHTDDILCIALCHESCAATGGHDGTIVIWNCESGHIREKLIPPPEALQEAGALGGRLPTVEQAVYAAHARLLITCGNDGWIRFWDVQRSRMVMQVMRCLFLLV
jgi:WD40 repeat protein